MDLGFRTPWLELFRRGEVPHDVRLLAARGALAPRAYEQLSLLMFLVEDADQVIRDAADHTIGMIPRGALAGFLARPEISAEMRVFFAARGIDAAERAATESDEPLIDIDTEEPQAPAAGAGEATRGSAIERLAALNVVGRLKAAMKGTREERAILIRDPNKLVSIAVLSSPKLTDTEVETFAKMSSVAEEVLRVIGRSRHWVKSYAIASALARNPKTPPPLAATLIPRLSDRDLKLLSVDRNVSESVRVAARKRVVAGRQ